MWYQNAFVKALRHREQFQGDAAPSTWIHRIVINEALMWLRSERRRRLYDGPDADKTWERIQSEAASPEQRTAQRQDLQQVNHFSDTAQTRRAPRTMRSGHCRKK